MLLLFFCGEAILETPTIPHPSSLNATPAPQTACALELQCWAEGLFSECLFVFCREAGINYHDHMLDNAEAYGMPASSVSTFYLFIIDFFVSCQITGFVPSASDSKSGFGKYSSVISDDPCK